MADWEKGDVAIAQKDAACHCGKHAITARHYYRVHDVLMMPSQGFLFGIFPVGEQEVFLDVLGGDAHCFHHSLFRKERPADSDIFKLCDTTPVVKQTEDA